MRWAFAMFACVFSACVETEAPWWETEAYPWEDQMTVVDAPDRAAEAQELVWSLLGADKDGIGAPRTLWVANYIVIDSHTYQGVYFPHRAWVKADSCQTPPCRPSQTYLVHELIHAALWVENEDLDHEHTAALWAEVEPLNELLSEAGL